MAAYAYHAMVLGYTNDEVHAISSVKALFALGYEDWGMDRAAYQLVMECGKS